MLGVPMGTSRLAVVPGRVACLPGLASVPCLPPLARPRHAMLGVGTTRAVVLKSDGLADAGKEPPVGFEPTTSRLLSGCSTN